MKKLTNLYRLVRLSVHPGQLDEFIGDREGGPYQAAALLLAVLVGAPREVHGLLVKLTEVSLGEDVTVTFGSTGFPGQLTTLIKELRDSGVAVHGDATTYRAWATTVARYGFETYGLFSEKRLTPPD